MPSSMAEVWNGLEAQGITEDTVQVAVERNLPYFEAMSDDDLRAVVGQAEIGQQMLGIQATTREQLIEAGDRAARRRNIHDVICDAKNRELIEEFITVKNVTAIVALALTAVGISIFIAPIVIGIAVLVLRIGLNEYCLSPSEEVVSGA